MPDPGRRRVGVCRLPVPEKIAVPVDGVNEGDAARRRRAEPADELLTETSGQQHSFEKIGELPEGFRALQPLDFPLVQLPQVAGRHAGDIRTGRHGENHVAHGEDAPLHPVFALNGEMAFAVQRVFVLGDGSAGDPRHDVFRQGLRWLARVVEAVADAVLVHVTAQPIPVFPLDRVHVPAGVEIDGRDPCQDGHCIDGLGRKRFEIGIQKIDLGGTRLMAVIVEEPRRFQIGPAPQVRLVEELVGELPGVERDGVAFAGRRRLVADPVDQAFQAEPDIGQSIEARLVFVLGHPLRQLVDPLLQRVEILPDGVDFAPQSLDGPGHRIRASEISDEIEELERGRENGSGGRRKRAVDRLHGLESARHGGFPSNKTPGRNFSNTH